jgi:hypothetical protein
VVDGGWFVRREKYCWLVADKPSEQGVNLKLTRGSSSREAKLEEVMFKLPLKILSPTKKLTIKG